MRPNYRNHGFIINILANAGMALLTP